MNNTELTLDQLAEIAGGPHYTTYGGSSFMQRRSSNRKSNIWTSGGTTNIWTSGGTTNVWTSGGLTSFKKDGRLKALNETTN